MQCPFCKQRLKIWPSEWHTNYGCDNPKCVQEDMPRYQVTYNNYPTSLASRCFMMDNLYIRIDYPNNCTIISKLDSCFLFDSVQIPRALDISLKDPYSALKKIKMLMTFS